MRVVFPFEVNTIGSKKKTTQTNSYSYIPHPGSADINALRNFKAEVNPTIPYRYAAAKEDLENSFHAPLGAATSPAARDAAARSASNRLRMDEAVDTAASYADANNANFGRQAAVAGMTSPQFAQTGGQTVQSTPFNWGGLLMNGIGGNVATAF